MPGLRGLEGEDYCKNEKKAKIACDNQKGALCFLLSSGWRRHLADKAGLTLFDLAASLICWRRLRGLGVPDTGLKPLKRLDRRKENGLGFRFA